MKSPRFSLVHSGTNIGEKNDSDLKKDNKVSGKSKSAANPDRKSASTAFVLSPTVSNTQELEQSGSKSLFVGVSDKGSGDPVGDGTSAKTAVVLSPTVSNKEVSSISAKKKAEIRDGKRKCTAIPISPTATEADAAYSTPEENTCRTIVVSPAPQQNRASGRGSSTRPFTISPLIGSHLRSLGSGRGSQMSTPTDIARMVKDLSDSVNKQGLLSKIYGPNPTSVEGSPLKRKSVYTGSYSSSKKRDDRPGMFTPPSFDLLGNSQETTDVVVDAVQETTDVVVDAVPLAWVRSQGS